MKKLSILFVAMMVASTAAAQWVPLQPGESVMTCFSGNVKGQPANPNAPVAAAVDIRNPAANAPGVNKNWAAPAQHPPSWTYGTLGEVFGIALDDASPPNIYLTATAIYNSTKVQFPYDQNAPGTGQIYKIDGATGVAAKIGAPNPAPPLPNSGGYGLGNIAYDAAHKQLFVTNFTDGKIYRLDMNGNIKSTFDPFGSPPSTTPGLADLGQRLWGIGVFRNRVYFGLWSSDVKPGPANTVWSVAIDATTGDFLTLGTAPDVTLPPLAGTMPISDIEFSSAGRMLLAEHGMDSLNPAKPFDISPHQSRVLEYVLSGTTWVPSTNTFKVGFLGPGSETNAAGGVDYACPLDNAPGFVVATGDALQFGPQLIYGLQITPQSGGSVANSYLIDADGNLTKLEKTEIGDVDVYNTCDRRCLERTSFEVLCAGDGTGDYLITFTFKNLTNDTIHHAFITGASAGTATPTYKSFLQNPIAPGGTGTIGPIRIHGAPPGPLTLTLSIHNLELEQCCAAEVRFELPPCECAQIVKSTGPFCTFFSGVSYSFELQNLFNGPVSYVLIAPDTPPTATFTANVFDLTSNPMGIGDKRTFLLNIAGGTPGGQVCFRISTHNEKLDQCCAIRQCVTIPFCWNNPIDWTLYDATFLVPEAGRVALINTAGNPGATIPLPSGATGAALQWDAATGFTTGASLEQRYVGTVGGGAARAVATLTTTASATGAELRTAFPGYGGSQRTIEFYRNGERVATQSGPDAVVICATCNASVKPESGFNASARPFAHYAFGGVQTFMIAGSPRLYEADEVRIIMANDLAGITRLSRLELQARGIPRLTLHALDVATDCDSDGVDDTGSECASSATSVALNTGFDETTNTVLPFGQLPSGTSDDDWTIVSPGAARPAKVVIDPHSNWGAPLANTRWISVDPNRGTSITGVTQIGFERCFCLTGSGAVTLDLQLRADNEASVFLNDQRLAGPGGAFSGAPLTVRRTGAPGDALFRAGRNCVRVEVGDFGVVTGLSLSGSVTGATETCP